MLKKLINSVAVFAMITAIVAPALAIAGSVSVASEVANVSSDKKWTTQTSAKPGDTLMYSVIIDNVTATTLKGVVSRVVVPAGLNFVPGSGKFYWKPVGATANSVVQLSDALIAENGVNLQDVPPMTHVYVSFKTQVASSATAGTVVAPTTQVFANGGGVNIGDSRAKTTVIAGTPSDGNTAPAPVASARIISTVLNETRHDQYYVSSATAKRGEELFYRVQVSNTGTTPLTGGVFKAQIPAGLEYVGNYSRFYFANATWVGLNDAIVSANGVVMPDIPVGSWGYVNYKVRVASNAVAGGPYSTSNYYYSNSGAVNLNDNGGKVTVEVSGVTPAPVASARIISTVLNETRHDQYYVSSATAKRGEELFYRVQVSNTGTTPLTGGVFKAQIPAGLEYVGNYSRFYFANATWVGLNDAIVSANGVVMPDIPVGSWGYVNYKVRVASNAVAGGPYSTSNYYYSNSGAVNLNDNGGKVTVEGDITPVGKSLSITSSIYDAVNKNYVRALTIKRGQSAVIRVAFANNGDSDLTNVRITNSLPANLQYIAGSMKVVVNGSTVSTSDSVISSGASIGSLAKGAAGYLDFTVKVKQDTPSNITQLSFTGTGNADGAAQVSSLATFNLMADGGTLPDTGTPGSIAALILLALFGAIASSIYLKESNALSKAAKLIKR